MKRELTRTTQSAMIEREGSGKVESGEEHSAPTPQVSRLVLGSLRLRRFDLRKYRVRKQFRLLKHSLNCSTGWKICKMKQSFVNGHLFHKRFVLTCLYYVNTTTTDLV